MSFRNERRTPQPPQAKPKIGIALSSGGAKSLAHVGVIQVLEEHGIEVHAITGSSMGIGLALARGLGEHGASVVLNARNAERLEEAAGALRGEVR